MNKNFKYCAKKIGSNLPVPFYLLFLLCFKFSVFSCGGGVVPYVPSQTGAGGNSALSGEFFLLEKGVATDMFDVKKLQPLFRNIVLSGNERKLHNSKKNTTSRVSSIGERSDVVEMQQDSVSLSNEKSESVPVLNLHRIH